jgi:cellulose biosynthesis protein BcsQ
MKYVIWNNKGGVGKTFLTYLLSTEYAKKNPDKDVVVVDACPQANVSEIILGGNGVGEENLEKCFNKKHTIAHYIKSRYRLGNTILGNELSFFVKAYEYNKNMPENLYLLPGDSDLDICANIINFLALAPEKKSWQKSRVILFDLLNSFQRTFSDREKTYFIDCNPSFSSYTELAILAADRLIIPCTADAASLRAIYNLFNLVHGVKIDKSERDDGDNVFDEFYDKATENGFTLPKIHQVIQNRSRTKEKKASKAFTAHVEKIENLMTDIQKRYSRNFTTDEKIVHNVKDGNTLAAVINHTGQMLGDIKIGKHSVYEMMVQIAQPQKDSLVADIDKIISTL